MTSLGISLGKPADFELAKAIAEVDASFGLVVASGQRQRFMEDAKTFGFVPPDVHKSKRWIGRLFGLEAPAFEVHTRIILRSRAAFGWLSRAGDLYCDPSYEAHPLSRDALKTRYDVDRFERDYYDWMDKRFKHGDVTAKEPVFTDMVYPTPNTA